MKYGVNIFLCMSLLFVLALPAQAENVSKPNVSAASAILVDADSGRVLYAKNENEKRLIASITKLMTGLVAVESQSDLKQIVTIKDEWTKAEGSSIYLKPSEKLSLEALLYGLLLRSGNDAALAVAGFCAGDVDTFVEWMNHRAQDLNMTNSKFQNPNGLNHDEHYSTASDMAKLAIAVLKNETTAKIVSTKTISMDGRNFTNSNKLLWNYDGCIGMKTGYTQDAGRTLVSAAKRDGLTLVVVTLSAPNDWRDHTDLFDYGFSQYENKEIISKDEEMKRIRVEGSFIRSVPVYANETIVYPLKENETAEIKISVPETVAAPIKQDAIAGKVEVFVDDSLVVDSYLRYTNSVQRDAVEANRSIKDMLNIFRGNEDSYLPPNILDENVEAT